MENIGISQAIRCALDDPRLKAKILEAAGWDASAVTRIKSDQQGIKLDRIDDVMRVLGYVAVEPSYMDFLAYGCRVGANCHCARTGGGACGSK